MRGSRGSPLAVEPQLDSIATSEISILIAIVSEFCIVEFGIHRRVTFLSDPWMEKTLNSERNLLFVQMLRDVRSAVGLTQIELADRLKVHQTEISRVERGIRRLDLLELHDWLEALSVPLVEFVVELDDRLLAMKARNRQPRPGRR